MLDAGYRFAAESDITAGERKGYLIELTAPLGAKDYTFLIALFMNDLKQLIIFESSGEISQFKKQRKEIVEAIDKSGF